MTDERVRLNIKGPVPGFSADDLRELDAVASVCDLASSNFPRDTDVVVTVVEGGRASGSVTISAYTLRNAIAAAGILAGSLCEEPSRG